MKYALRALASALMLLAAAVLAAVIVVALGAALVVAFRAGGRWAVAADITVVALLAALGAGVFLARRRRRSPLVGVPVTSFEQPLLWVEIYRVAEGLRTKAPDELLLVPDAKVTASQRRTWLGVRPGVRRLRLGLPLMTGLTERQLRAVITHEFARCWGPGLLARVIERVAVVIGRVVDAPAVGSRAGRAFSILRVCGGAYLAVSGPVCRRHELDADRLCAELAGNDATTAAFAELPVLRRGWEAFVDGYIEPAAAAGRRPSDVFAGFASFLQEPDRRAQLVQEAGGPASPQLSGHDGQPSLRDRLAAVASLPEDKMRDRSRPAMDLLRDAGNLIRQVEESMAYEAGLAPATWQDVVPAAARAAASREALQLARLADDGGLGAMLSVATVLDLMSFGLAEEMVRPMLGEGSSPKAQREMTARLITGFLATAAIESGTASYRFSWVTPRLLVDDRGAVDNLARLVECALGDQGEVPALERWLSSHRVGRELDLGAELDRGVLGELPDAPAESPREDPLAGPHPVLVPAPGIPST
jgi:Zn-dependent protease with chaperone function